MAFTNKDGEISSLKDNLISIFEDAEEINIAVGYVSTDTVKEFKPRLTTVANSGGLVRLLVGMAFFEGLTKHKRDYLNQLDQELASIDSKNGVFIPYTRRYHGKIYDVIKNGSRRAFVGSNNFSQNAFKLNLECSVEILDAPTVSKVNNYIKYLFSDSVSTHINKAELPTTGIPARASSVLLPLENPPVIPNLENFPYFEIDLAEVSMKEKSNLNVYFGKGRLSRTTGKIAPRPWYEIEIINKATVTKQRVYPSGAFDLITSDGYKIPMTTNGDYNKNMRSRGGLQMFGQWLKGKLEKNGALSQYEPVTPETFEVYGKSIMKLYKIDDFTYYTDF